MNKIERKALKIVKKGFTIGEWKEFAKDIQTNELVISEVVRELENKPIDYINLICKDYPFIIKHLADELQLRLVTNENFCFLGEKLQKNIMDKNPNKVKYADKDIQIEYATKNPPMFSYLDEKLQIEMIGKNKFYLGFASQDIQVECVRKDSNFLSCCANVIQCGFVKQNPNYYPKCSHEVKRDIIVLANLNPEIINEETLESYLSCHYDDLSLEELNNYKEKIKSTSRNDKDSILGYIEYLQINLEKKKL